MMKLGRLVADGTPAELKERVSTGGQSPSMEQVFLRLTQASKSERSNA